MWFTLRILFFSVRTKSTDPYTCMHCCDAARAMLGKQYRPAFLTSPSSKSYRRTMTALITSSIPSTRLFPMVPIQNHSLSLRCPFKRNTKPAVSVHDLLTPNPVYQHLQLHSVSVCELVSPLCQSQNLCCSHVWRICAALRGANSSATYRSTRRYKLEM